MLKCNAPHFQTFLVYLLAVILHVWETSGREPAVIPQVRLFFMITSLAILHNETQAPLAALQNARRRTHANVLDEYFVERLVFVRFLYDFYRLIISLISFNHSISEY